MSIETAPATTALGETLATNPLRIDDEAADLLFREARTVNRFAEEPVTDDHVRAAYDLVRWGPTAMNTLPLRLLLVRTPEARERLGAHMNEGNRAKTLAAPLTIVAAADPGFHTHLGFLAPHMEGATERFEAGGPDMRSGMARTSALIQVGYFVVGLRAVGLHAGPMGGFDAAGVNAEFFGDNGWQSLLVINVGLPAAEGASHPRQARLEFDQVSLAV